MTDATTGTQPTGGDLIPAVILVGSDRYASHWHDHAANAQRIAEELRPVGINARIRQTHPRSFGELAGARLLIVEAGDGARAEDDASDEDWARAHRQLAEYVSRGGAVLAVHNAVGAFGDLPAWCNWVGGRWVRGVSMHPPFGESELTPRVTDHPIVDGLGTITVQDELYAHLDRADDNEVLLHYRHDDQKQPLVWVRDGGPAPGRVVVDLLGHDTRSYDSPARVRLLRREALWAVGADSEAIRAV
jgi:uncharacterized protein